MDAGGVLKVSEDGRQDGFEIGGGGNTECGLSVKEGRRKKHEQQRENTILLQDGNPPLGLGLVDDVDVSRFSR